MRYPRAERMLYAEQFRDSEGLLFDLDLTLVTFGEAKRTAVNRAINDMIDAGLPLNHAEAKLRVYRIYKQNGIEYQLVFDELLNGMELPRTAKNRIWAAGVHGYRETRKGVLATYPHIIPTLLELSRRGYKLGAISDAPEKEVWLRIFDTRLEPYFQAVITFDEDALRKPHPSVFRKALRELGLRPEQAVMIGDNPPVDLAGAKRIGMRTIWAKYGLQDTSVLDEAERLVFYSQTQDPNDKNQIPDAEINDAEELLDLLPTIHR